MSKRKDSIIIIIVLIHSDLPIAAVPSRCGLVQWLSRC